MTASTREVLDAIRMRRIRNADHELFATFRPWELTDAEIAAGVTPVNYAYAPVNVLRYGAVGDGVTDDTAAIAQAILVLAELTNATLYFPGGYTFAVSEVLFDTMTDFAVLVDGTIVSNLSKPGGTATDMRSDVTHFDDCVLKFDTCERFQVSGSGAIDNRFVQALFITSCADFDISLDCISNGSNDNLPGIYIRYSTNFVLHDCTWDGVTLNPMNTSGFDYHDWLNNIQLWDSETFQIVRVLSRQAGYAAVYVGSNCSDLSITDCIGEACAGTAFQFSWSSFGTMPVRYTVENCIGRYCQADAFASDCTGGTPISAMAAYIGNQGILCGWRNGDPGQPATADGSGLTLVNVTDVTVVANCFTGNSFFGISLLDDCHRVNVHGNVIFKDTGTAGSTGIYVNESSDVTICGNMVTAASFEAYKQNGATARVRIVDNDFVGAVSFPTAGGGISYTDCSMSGNRMDVGANGVNATFSWRDTHVVYSGSSTAVTYTADNVRLEGGSIRALSGTGVTGANLSGLALVGFDIYASVKAVSIDDCIATLIQANYLESNTGATCHIQGTSDRTVINSNRVNNTGAANSVRCEATTTLTSTFGNQTVAGPAGYLGTMEINFP